MNDFTRRFAIALLVMATRLDGAVHSHDVNVAEECRVRDGLPNFLAKVEAGRPVRVAFVGGSITAAAGWRPKTLAWLRARYPRAEIAEINAAISGTGSDYGACRLRDDVLSRDPDLVFLECRVNGGGGFELESVEGIVRQVWKHDPRADICFVYTIGQWMLKDLHAGKTPWFGPVMENVANAYGIPTIDLGIEIARRERAGTLIFKGDAPQAGKLVFSQDGVHPGDEGHAVYCEVIARSMLAMTGRGVVGPHALPAPLHAGNWEVASLLPVTNATLSAGWSPVDTADDPTYTDDRERTHAMLRGAVKCDRAGASITVRWRGTTVGFSDIPHGGACVVQAVIDGGTPVRLERAQTEKAHRYARFWYLPAQAPGEHSVTLTVQGIPEGTWFYAGQLLIVGSPLIETRINTRGPDADNLTRLARELDRAEVVPAADVPHDVITMDSVVEPENLANGDKRTFTLVFPDEADADHDRSSGTRRSRRRSVLMPWPQHNSPVRWT